MPSTQPRAARIAFVAPFGLGQKTTVWARTLPLARRLVEHGHHVTIIIPPWDTPADAGRTWDDHGVAVVNVALQNGLLATTRRMLRAIDAFTPHIVHIVKPRAHAGLVQWWLWQRRRLRSDGPTLLLDVDDWEQAWAEINHYPWPVAKFLAWQEEWGIRHADGITAASQWLMQQVEKYTPHTPRRYLPNGVDALQPVAVEQRNDNRSRPHRVLYFTRFVEIEPTWLAAFWQALHAATPTAQLVIAGSALVPGREALFQQALRQVDPATQQVEWLGFVSGAEIDALYAGVDCAIFPAQAVPLQQAKCSVRLATTLLHGVPVVASAVGEQAAYGAEDSAVLVAATATPAQFAAAVADMLEQPEQRQAMVASAQDRLQRDYAWPVLGDRLIDFYARWLR